MSVSNSGLFELQHFSPLSQAFCVRYAVYVLIKLKLEKNKICFKTKSERNSSSFREFVE